MMNNQNPASDAPGRGHGYLAPILLVEDNPVDVDLTLRAFSRQRFGRPVLVARDGEEALAWLARWQAGEPVPQLILLDLKLPRVDGLEVLRRFKSMAVSRRVPVVVLTTSREDADIQRAYDLGANSYIVKPVEFERFREISAQLELYWCVLNTPPQAALTAP